MDTLLLKNVSLNELPAAWRAQLATAPNTRVTVRIDAEPANTEAQTGTQQDLTANPLFGLWQDRTDMTDVAQYVRQLRAPRFNPDGSRIQD